MTSGSVNRLLDGAQNDERVGAHLPGWSPATSAWHLVLRRGKAFLVLETGEPLGLILAKVLVAK